MRSFWRRPRPLVEHRLLSQLDAVFPHRRKAAAAAPSAREAEIAAGRVLVLPPRSRRISAARAARP